MQVSGAISYSAKSPLQNNPLLRSLIIHIILKHSSTFPHGKEDPTKADLRVLTSHFPVILYSRVYELQELRTARNLVSLGS